MRARISVPVPRTPDVAAALDDADVGDAGLFEPGTGDQSREAAADDHDRHLVRDRRTIDRLGVRVVQEVGEPTGRFDVLVVAVRPEPLFALLAVLGPQCLAVDRIGNDGLAGVLPGAHAPILARICTVLRPWGDGVASAGGCDLVLLLPPTGGRDLSGVGAQRRVLTEVGRRRADAIRDGSQRVEVEAVTARRPSPRAACGCPRPGCPRSRPAAAPRCAATCPRGAGSRCPTSQRRIRGHGGGGSPPWTSSTHR